MSGKFVLSLDTELAWGTRHRRGVEIYKSHFENYRPLVARLVGLLEEYQIKATWAFVGHLFLDSCDGKHAELLDSSDDGSNRDDWRWHDPGTDMQRDPYWYGKDILDKVLTMKPGQEIAAHTFSHVVLDNGRCSAETARSQVQACVELGRQNGLAIESFVFPRGKVAHLQEVSETGIRAFRGIDASWHRKAPRRVAFMLRGLDHLLAVTPPVYELSRLDCRHNMVDIPASQFLLPYDGFGRYVPTVSRIAKAKKGIKAAIDRNAIYHLWFHPFNLGGSDRMFYVLKEIFEAVSSERDKGNIEDCTMKEIRQIFVGATCG
jgi:peptidoglycan/xylan/chitin deacetylase (PgdA/CDA1 family)